MRATTYKQALRGLFTSGTSLPDCFRENKRKGRWQTEDRFRYFGSPYNHAGLKPQTNERNYW